MSGRKTKTNHIFLRVTMTLAQGLNANTEGAKELSLIDHPSCLENRRIDCHEQNSCGVVSSHQQSVGSIGPDVPYSAAASRRCARAQEDREPAGRKSSQRPKKCVAVLWTLLDVPSQSAASGERRIHMKSYPQVCSRAPAASDGSVFQVPQRTRVHQSHLSI